MELAINFSKDFDSFAHTIGFPFARHRGLSYNRFNELLNGDGPNDKEREILEWNYNIGTIIAAAMAIEDFDKSDEILDKARKIASEYLDEETMNRTELISVLKIKSFLSPELITDDDKLYLIDIIFDDYEDDLIYYSRDIINDEALIERLLERSRNKYI